MSKRRFVALDRDGTLNVERHYLRRPEEVELTPDATSGLRMLRQMGLGLVVVTNQSAVGRGWLDEEGLAQIHARLTELLWDAEITLDGIYHCPHTPEDGCHCRKPRTGLLEEASKELDFDPRECFVIGDKPSDIELGHRVGAVTILVLTGYGAGVSRDQTASPDYTAAGLDEAAHIIGGILSQEKRAHQKESVEDAPRGQ